MYCSDPDCSIREPHNHDFPVESPEEVIDTLRQQLQDFEKENAILREAISDAWQTHTTCQQALVEAQSQVQELTEQNRMLSQYLVDTSEGFECLPGCDSNGHEPTCPVRNPVVAWRLIRDQLQDLRSQLDQAKVEVQARAKAAEFRRHINILDPDSAGSI